MARKFFLLVLIVVGCVCVWLLFSRLFPSEKKRLEWTLDDIRTAIESGNPQRCVAFVSPAYNYHTMDRKAMEEFAKTALALTGPMQVKTLKQEVKVLRAEEGTFGVVAGEIISLPCPGTKLPGPVKTSWNLMFRKEGKDWKVWQIELNSVNDQRVGGLQSLVKLAEP
jgi:hypothetical protein